MRKRMVWVLGGSEPPGKYDRYTIRDDQKEGQEAVKDELRGQRAEFGAVYW